MFMVPGPVEWSKTANIQNPKRSTTNNQHFHALNFGPNHLWEQINIAFATT